MTLNHLVPVSVLLIGSALSASLATLPTAALADDDDLYCWVTDDGDIDCDTVEVLKILCQGVPPGRVEECDDVNRMFIVPMGLTDGSGTNDDRRGGHGQAHTPSSLGLARAQ